MRRLASVLVAVLALLAIVAPVATGATGGPTVRLLNYQPVKPLAVANASVSASNTIIMKYSGGTLEVTIRHALVNQTLLLSGGSLVVPHLYAWYFNNSGYITAYIKSYPSGGFVLQSMAYFANMTDSNHTIATLGFNYGSYKGLEFRTFKYSSKMYFALANGTKWYALYSSEALAPRKWYVLDAAFNGTHMVMLVNNTFSGAVAFAGAPAWDTNKPLTVSNTYNFMEGYIRYTILADRSLEGHVVNKSMVLVFLDPTFYLDGVYYDLAGNVTASPTNVARVPDNTTWYWIVEDYDSDGYVHFSWAPDGYAYYVYSNNTLIGIYYNGDKASLNGTYRVVLAPALPKNVTAGGYGGVILYNLPAYSVVEFWLGDTRVKTVGADCSGIVTVSLPQGNYTVKVYPPAWDPQHPVIVLDVDGNYTYESVNISGVLEEYGYSGVSSVEGAEAWGFASGVLYLVNASSLVTVYLNRGETVREPPLTSIEVTAGMIIENGTVNGQDVFGSYENGKIYASSSVVAAKFIFLNSSSAEYEVKVRPAAGASKSGGGIAVAYLPANDTVYAVRLQSGADHLSIELASNGRERDVTGIDYVNDVGKWYVIHVRVFVNGTLEAWANDSGVLTWQLPEGAKLVLGPYIDDDRPLWDFANVTVTLGSYVTVNYTIVDVIRYARVSVVAPSVANTSNYTVNLEYSGDAYSWMRILVNGTVYYTGVAGNASIEVVTIEDETYNVTVVFLDPLSLSPIYNASAITVVDARPPVLSVRVIGVSMGSSTLLIQVEAEDYEYIVGSINGTPFNVTPGEVGVWLPGGPGHVYNLTIIAVDSHNRASRWTGLVWAPAPGEAVGVPPEAMANALEQFINSISIDWIVNYLNAYTWGLFGVAWLPTVLMAVWLKSRSASLTFAVAIILAYVGGPSWMALVAVLSFAVLLYMAWQKAR